MKKRLIALLLCAFMLFSLVPAAAADEIRIVDPVSPAEPEDDGVKEGKCGDALRWTLDKDGKLTVSGSGEMWDFWSDKHPDAVGWYESMQKITSVVIESGVTSVGDWAFCSATNLSAVSISNTVTRVGDWAFCACVGLESIKLPKSVERIGENAFSYDNSLSSVTLGSGLREIGKEAFAFCIALAELSLPTRLNKIGAGAFSQCYSLTALVIPEAVTEIGDGAFHGCAGLADGDGYVIVCGVLYDYYGTDASPSLPDALTEISGHAFEFNDTLERLTIPDGVVRIGDYAFYFSSLREIEIPDSVTVIGEAAFSDCQKLTKLRIPDSVAQLGDWAFSYCENLTELCLPQGMTGIPQGLCSDCSSLETLSLPSGVAEIGESAFSFCSALETLALPAALTKLGDRAFECCDALVGLALPAALEEIGASCFYACPALTQMEIPASVQKIGARAFSDCEALEALTVSAANPCYRSEDGVLFSADGALLHSYPAGREGGYTVAPGVAEVEKGAFDGAKKLTAVRLPASLRTLGEHAFKGCSALTEIVFEGPAPEIDSTAFLDVASMVYYPAGDPSWTEELRQDYGGDLSWAPYAPLEAPVPELVSCTTGGVTLRWTDLGDGVQYELQRKAEGDWQTLAVLNASSCTDASAKMGVSYRYRVRAGVSGSWTAYSEPLELFYNPFTDITGKKTIEYVAWAFNNGVIVGTSETRFSPNRPCTRAQFVMMLWKMHGCPVLEGTNPFGDVTGSKTTKAILWALDAGVINSGDSFDPDGSISRVQIVMILWKLAGCPDAEGENPFADVTGSKTTKAVLWAYQNGITKGVNETSFAPDRACARVQLVVFLYKYNKLFPILSQ